MQSKTFRVHIEELTFDAIIGILEHERTTAQKVVVNVTFSYTYTDEFVDYAAVAQIIKKSMIENKYLLIEDALEEISKIIKKNFPLITSLDLEIKKPTILPDARVSVALVS
jgi:dihydroneopterin aldolase